MQSPDWTADRLRVPSDAWLALLRDEYLSEFLPAGGAAVRFVSGSSEALDAVARSLTERARQAGYHVARLDPAALSAEGKRPDLHRIERFYFAVTAEVDWPALARRLTNELLAGLGLQLAPNEPLGDLDRLAADNGLDPTYLRGEYQRAMSRRVVTDRAMLLEFRAALMTLSHATMVREEITPTTEEVVLAWLAGRTLPGAARALKRVGIYERITATNARHMLQSFSHLWRVMCGGGTVVILDLRPYEQKRRRGLAAAAEYQRLVGEAVSRGLAGEELLAHLSAAASATVCYSEPAYRAMLALLRRFIDEAELFEGFLLVVLTTPGFYDDNSPRNYYDYDALQTRIGLEVRDAHRANPTAALVHLGDGR